MRFSIMLVCIMLWVDRESELGRLNRLLQGRTSALSVVYGRRRIGKTRLLVEWARQHEGVYTVADQSTPDIQRRYFASAIGQRLEGFGEVEYPDWTVLLSRLAREARAAKWRGPIVFDELPYLVAASPELPSVLQRWVDHEAKEAQLVVALAGSSQRMMQGLVLSASAPLFGRAKEILPLGPLPAGSIPEVFRVRRASDVIDTFAAWGGVPRYWELASEMQGSVVDQLEALVLDPVGALHREPDRLLLEELPPAIELRPVLDAIGAGAHRVSEIAGRLGRPATSLPRPLDRLLGLGLVAKEIPFGDSERKSKRSLYKIVDPFIRMWFRVVAPHRAALAAGTKATRKLLLERYWPALVSTAWEDLCRSAVPRLGDWGPASRWWSKNDPEWDVVSESRDGKRLLLGEVKWHREPMSRSELRAAASELDRRQPPQLSKSYDEIVRMLFVPETTRRPGENIVVGAEVLNALG